MNITPLHEGNDVREFYSKLPRPVRVGIEATGSMHWFLNLMEELGIECQVGHPAQIRAHAARRDPQLERFYRRKLVQKRSGEGERGHGAQAGDSVMDHVAG